MNKRSVHDRARAMRQGGFSIRETARLTGMSASEVRRVCGELKPKSAEEKARDKLLAEKPGDEAWAKLVAANFA